MLSSSKQFGSLLLRGLPLLMGVLLLMVFGTSTANAQVTPNVGVKTYIPLEHTLSNYGDSLKYKLAADTVIESAAGKLVTTSGDSIQIKTPAKFNFVKDSIVTILASVEGGLRFDTTGFFATYGITQTSDSLIKVKPLILGATGGYISFMVKTASSTIVDTLTISGLYVQSSDTTGLKYDSTTTASILFSQLGGSTNNANLNTLVALPGAAATIAFDAARLPNDTQTAGKYINFASGGTLAVDTSKGISMYFFDKKGNLTTYGVSAPSVIAVIAGESTLGNGTLAGNSTTHWMGDAYHHIGISFDGLTYTKAETIDLKFTFGSSTINTHATTLSSGIAFNPGVAANISVALQSGNSDEITVDQTTAYTLTVTDQYFNPVIDGTTVSWSENLPHGGTFAPTFGTTSSGQVNVSFAPSKFFVGADTLKFTSPISSHTATQTRAIKINPGALGGVMVDYAGTASGAAVTEDIAAGHSVYVRAYLRDTYGNPINASDTSVIKFSSTKGTLTQSGKVLVPSLKTSLYPNTDQTSTAIALPIVVSKKSGDADVVTAQTTSGGYSVSETITVRSDVPAKLKMVQTVGGDSSIVASKYAIGSSIAFADTAWDTYGNLSVAPDASWKIAPTRSSYAIYFSTNGLVKFDRVADTTAADTLYLDADGAVNRTVASGTKSGVDTVKTWSANSSSVAASTPVLVTPSAYAALVLTPATVTTAIAGQTSTLTVEKLDAFGNHIDWGTPGDQTVTDYKTAFYTGDTLATYTKLIPAINTELASLQVDTVTTNKNRGGSVDATKKATIGNSALASVGGSLEATFPFTAFVSSADTQRVYASLGGFKDTSIIYSMSTGLLRSFIAKITASDSVKNAGDSVAVTFTALDSLGHRIYTYVSNGQTLTVNHTGSSAVATKDTTYYFTYENNHNKIIRSNGLNIQDTVFNQGQATFWLRKFVVDSTNTVTISAEGFTETAAQGVTFKPLNADSSFGFWTISAPDTLKATGALDFTVTPRDKYSNVSFTPKNIIANVSSNQTSGFNIGSNPKVINGPTTFNGTLSGASGSLVIYVFNSANAKIYVQSAPVVINPVTGIDKTNELPKEYALMQNYPNPFNPTTLIKYDLPKAGLVTLKVYDLLGREVATLINGNQAAGKYSVQFNASKLASGVYIYRIQSNNFSAVKKLMLLK